MDSSYKGPVMHTFDVFFDISLKPTVEQTYERPVRHDYAYVMSL